MLETLKNENRVLIEADLKPVQGDRFQPTGFADLGAAVYEAPRNGKSVRKLLVESAQSMANRLEAVCLDGSGPGPVKELEVLPYVSVELTGATSGETSSLVEAHRLNSPFIVGDKGFLERFVRETSYRDDAPLDWPKIGRTIFRYDPSSLVHGLFMANLGGGRLRLPRALSAFIEAEDVREAASGGVKNSLDASGTIRVESISKDVYSNVPYPRIEYTAAKITVFFSLDLALIRGWKLPAPAERLLIALALFKVRRWLSGSLRLRTACDLELVGAPRVMRPGGFVLPEEDSLLKEVQAAIGTCEKEGLFASKKDRTLKVATIKTKKTEEAETDSEEPVDAQVES